MIPLRFSDNKHEIVRHPEDVEKLKAILNARGFDASDLDIQRAYETWSEETMCAGWLDLECTNDDGLFMALMGYLEPF